jgi:hypothetical protein
MGNVVEAILPVRSNLNSRLGGQRERSNAVLVKADEQQPPTISIFPSSESSLLLLFFLPQRFTGNSIYEHLENSESGIRNELPVDPPELFPPVGKASEHFRRKRNIAFFENEALKQNDDHGIQLISAVISSLTVKF